MSEDLNERLGRLCRSVEWDTAYVLEAADGSFKAEKDGGKKFSSASVIKLNIMWSVYKRISSGLLNKEQLVEVAGKDIAGGSGVLCYLNEGHSLTIRELCALMIDFSDNTATNILIDAVGREAINADINELMLGNTVLRRKMMDSEARLRGDDNFTSAEDAVRLLKFIESSDLVKPELREDMLKILSEQSCKAYLTQYMPARFKCAHKTGSLDDVLHDAGIIRNEKGRMFYVAVMTSGFPNFESGLRFINSFGAELFEYLE